LTLGDSVFVIRGLSAVVGIATIAAVFVLGKRLFGFRVGFVASCLLAVNAFHISWSQQARGYALVTFLLVLSACLFLAGRESPRPLRRWIAYVLTAAAAIYCQVLAVLVVVAQWLSLDRRARSAVGLPRFLAIAAGLLLLVMPMLAFVVLRDNGQLDWVPRLTAGGFQGFLRTFVGSAVPAGTPAGHMLLFGYAMTATAGAASLIANRGTYGPQGRFVGLWLALPIALLVLVSVRRAVFVDRFLLMCLPAAVLLSAVGIVGLERRRFAWRALAAAVTIAVMVLAVSERLRQYRTLAAAPDNWRAATERILADQQPADAAIFFTAAGRLSFAYYAHLQAAETRMTPAIVAPDFTRYPTGEQPIPTREDIQAAIRGRPRVWLVLNNGSIGLVRARRDVVPMIRTTLEEAFTAVREERLQGDPDLTIVLYERTGERRVEGTGRRPH
jgi:mannosyltransferase